LIVSEVPVCEIIEAALDNVKSLLKVVTPVTAENVVIPETVTTEDVNVKEPVRALIRIFPALPVDELEPEMRFTLPAFPAAEPPPRMKTSPPTPEGLDVVPASTKT
jgi:hypothetical protein